MPDIRFYHLQTQNLDQALPLILEKAYATNKKIVVQMANPQEVERMCGHLWAYQERSFLPHGSKKDGHAPHQPIWVTDQDDTPNDASILILTQDTRRDDISPFDLCCEIFDGRSQDAVNRARQQWKTYKEMGYDITYWQQSDTGRWEQKA